MGAGLVAAGTLGVPGAAAQAQALDLGRDIPIAVAMPPDLDAFGASVRGQLQSRLTQIVTGSGMAAVDGYADIVLFPELVITGEERTDGLIQNVDVIRMEIVLYVKNAMDGALFASTAREVTGSGRGRDRALRDAVRQLNGRDPSIRAFVRDARAEIVGYYERNCRQILSESRAMATAGEIQEGLALLFAVPRDAVQCHQATNDAAAELFAAHEADLCQARVRRAEAELALDHYGASIDALMGVRDSGPCGRRAQELIASIEGEVGQRSEVEFQARLERYRAFTDTIGSGVEATAGPDAAARERTLARARMEAVVALNRPAAREFPPDLFRTSG